MFLFFFLKARKGDELNKDDIFMGARFAIKANVDLPHKSYFRLRYMCCIINQCFISRLVD